MPHINSMARRANAQSQVKCPPSLKPFYARIVERTNTIEVWGRICDALPIGQPFGTMQAWKAIQPYFPQWADSTGYDITNAILHWAYESAIEEEKHDPDYKRPIDRPHARNWILTK